MHSDKVCENRLSETLCRMIYVAMKDIETRDESARFDERYRSAENYPGKKIDGLRNRFTVSSPAKQILRIIMRGYFAEISAAGHSSISNVDDFINKTKNTCAEAPYFELLSHVYSLPKKYGHNIDSFSDKNGWVSAFVISSVINNSGSETLFAYTTDIFNGFLKHLAWNCAMAVWYSRAVVNDKYLFTFIAANGFPIEEIESVRQQFREPKRKPVPVEDILADI